MSIGAGIRFPITADPRTGAAMGQIKAQLSGVKGALATVNDHARRVGRSMRNIGLGMSAGVTAPLALIGRDAVRLFDIQKQAEDSVRQVLTSTNGASGKTADELFRLASGMQQITTFGDEDILRNVTAPLLTFTKVAGPEFDRAQASILDMATLLKTDLRSAAVQVGKALNDPIKGVSALGEAGVQFSEEQKKMIKSLVETGDVAKAQQIILAELETQFKGQAEAAAGAPLGAMKQLSNSIGDLKEQLGEQIVPFLVPLVRSVTQAVSWFSKLSPSVKRNVVIFGALAAVTGPVLAFFGLAAMGIAGMTTALGVMATAIWPITAIVAALGAMAAIATYVHRNWDGLGGFFRNLWADVKAVHVSGWQTLKAEAEKYSPETVRVIEEAWAGHATVMTSVWKSQTDGFKKAFGAIRDLARGQFSPANMILPQWDGLPTAIGLSFDGVKVTLAAKWEEIKLMVGQWPADFLQLGRDLIAGLQLGIEEKIEAVKASIGAAMESVIGIAKRVPQVQSPSRVFKSIGRFLMEGLQLGIDAGAPLAEAAMGKVSETITKPLGETGVGQVAGSVKQAFTSLFQSIVSGSGNAADAVKRLGQSLLSIVLEKSVFGLLSKLAPTIFGGDGTIPLVANANGNAFVGGRVQAFASGGVVSRPTLFGMQGGMGLMGEAGPEGILPLGRVGGKLGVYAGGSGRSSAPAVNIEFKVENAHPGAIVGQRRERGPDGREMIIATVSQAEAEGEFDRGRQSRYGQRPKVGRFG